MSLTVTSIKETITKPKFVTHHYGIIYRTPTLKCGLNTKRPTKKRKRKYNSYVQQAKTIITPLSMCPTFVR